MSRKRIYYLYWALPILFLLWELLITELPLIRDYLPQQIRESITDPPRSPVDALASMLLPFVIALMTIGKYIYITICYLLRKKPTVVLVLTIILITAFLAIDYALYLPFNIEVEKASSHQVRLFHFVIGIITYCPFFLCVYYLIRRIGTLLALSRVQSLASRCPLALDPCPSTLDSRHLNS